MFSEKKILYPSVLTSTLVTVHPLCPFITLNDMQVGALSVTHGHILHLFKS